MPWSTLQELLRRISTPIRHITAFYALLVALFTILRLAGVRGVNWVDLANAFAPYLYMPLVITFPLSIIVTRQSGIGVEAARKRLERPRDDFGDVATQPPRWSVFLQICLIAVGLYWFAAPAMYRPVDPPSGATFSVVTFNVQGSNMELRRATDWLLQRAPELIVLQETAEGFDARLAPLYDAYVYEDHIDGSVRIFTRYPILAREVLVIEDKAEDRPGRYALRLLLNADGRELAVYAAHFSLPLKGRGEGHSDAEIGFGALRYDERRRNAQIDRLLDTLADETAPFIVAGDFNMSDASLIYDEVAGRMQDAWRGAGTGAGRTWPVAEAIGLPRVVYPVLRIDYVWHSDELRATASIVGPAIGSDHLPVSAEFEWFAI